MTRLRKLGIAFLVFCVLAIGLFALQSKIFPLGMRWLDIGETPVKADAVFVLLGNTDTRPFVAAGLYHAGLASELLLARHTPLPNDGKEEPPGHEEYVSVFRHRGVPADAIRLLGDGIVNTMTESDVLAEYLDENPEATVTIVTTHFHTRRTRWSFRKNLGDRADRLHYVSAPHDDFDASNWWIMPRGFELVMMEFVKHIAYFIVYGPGLWLGVVGGLLGSVWLYRRRVVANAIVSATASN